MGGVVPAATAELEDGLWLAIAGFDQLPGVEFGLFGVLGRGREEVEPLGELVVELGVIKHVRLPADAGQSIHAVEVGISRQDREAMLQGERGDPYVIGGYRSARPIQDGPYRCVDPCGFQGDRRDAKGSHDSIQPGLVLGPSSGVSQSVEIFAH